MMDETFVLDRVQAHGGQPERVAARNGHGSQAGAGNGWAGAGRVASSRQPVSAPTGQPGQSSTRDARASGFTEPVSPRARQAQQPRSPFDRHDPIVNVERLALKLAIQRPALCGPAFDELPPTVFTVPTHAAVSGLIAASGGVASASSAREWSERLRVAAPNDEARGFVTGLAVEPLEVAGAAAEPDARFAEAVLARVEELWVSRQIASIKSRLQRLSPVAEQADYNRMFGDLVALEQRRKLLSERAAGAL
jgi:DNA primase